MLLCLRALKPGVVAGLSSCESFFTLGRQRRCPRLARARAFALSSVLLTVMMPRASRRLNPGLRMLVRRQASLAVWTLLMKACSY
jgi:hypothetical protein